MPNSESYNKGVQIVCKAVKCDKEKQYVDAFNLYCEALRYFVPLIVGKGQHSSLNARVKIIIVIFAFFFS